MTSNQNTLRRLFDAGLIDIYRGPLFGSPLEPMPEDPDFDRVEGMMLGLAVGDALGSTSESLPPRRHHELFGRINGYLPHPYAGNEAIGLPTDDTQLAFWTLEQMLADDGLDPRALADRFCAERIFGLGSTIRRFLHNYGGAGMEWHLSGPKSAGNGALMRIAPLVISHLNTGGTGL